MGQNSLVARSSAMQLPILAALGESTTFEDLSERILKAVCETLDWELGNFWYTADQPNSLKKIRSWSREGYSTDECPLHISCGTNIPNSRLCLPVNVFQLKEPVWIENVRDDREFFNACWAAKKMSGSVLAFPIFSNGQLTGVMEFFTREPRQRDDILLQMLASFGDVIGQAVERRKTSEALAVTEDRLKTIVSLLPDVVWSVEIEKNGEPGEVTFASDACKSVYGHEASDFVQNSKLWIEMIVEEDRPIAIGAFERAVHCKKIVKTEYRIRHRDGRIRWLEDTMGPLWSANGDLHGVTGVTRDITEIKQAEFNLRELIDRSPDGIMVHRFGPITYMNHSMAHMLGYGHAAELIGNDVVNFVHPDFREQVRQRIENLKVEEAHYQRTPLLESKLMRKDGTALSVEATAMRLNFNGEPAIVVILRDITERKQTQAQQLLSDRMISMGTLAAGVAHEINNPLAAIMANLDYILQNKSNGTWQSDQEDALKDARDAARRIRDIVRDLKIFSRTSEEKTKAVDVNSVIESSLRMAWNEIRHRARLVKDYGKIPPVQGSESRMGQLFLNLIVNAAQAIPEGMANENTVRIVTHSDSRGSVTVEISDSGSGMSAEVQRRLFEPFFTTKPVGIGTGLGLSICHRIVTELKGMIQVTSEVGKGTCVRVTLPANDEDVVGIKLPTAIPVSPRRGKILLIDDEEAICKSMKRILEREHDVESVQDAREALRKLKEGEQYDVIFCDLMMPLMTGMDFYAELDQADPKAARRIVFLSGGAFTPRAQGFLQEVANQRLEKPLDTQQLRATINDRLRLPNGA
jgi:two-component system, cell cycle sensor histidine kinase and response regulator CckA